LFRIFAVSKGIPSFARDGGVGLKPFLEILLADHLLGFLV